MFRNHGSRVDLDMFVGMIEVFITSLPAQACRLSLQQHWMVGLWQGEDAQHEDREGPDRFDVFRPAPAEGWVHEDGGPDEGPEGWAADDGDGVEGYGYAADALVPDVSESSGYVTYWSGAKDTTEQAGDEDGCGVPATCCAYGEDRQEEDRWQDTPSPAPNFCDWSPAKRTKCESKTGWSVLN